MKKTLISAAAVLALTAALPLPASAADSAEVFVTISDNTGALALAAEPVTVTDADGDGTLTINDALYIAHENHYDGGAAAGYGNSRTGFGLGITKLWGIEQASGYGYCMNNASAMSLEDPITEGSFVNAYCYTDLTGFSDTYCFFDVNIVSVQSGVEFTLTLTANGYDENWNPIQKPVEGAVITINGEVSAFRTDAEGKVTLTLENAGNAVLSAVSDTEILIPPVCKAEVTAPETTADTTASANTTTSQTTAAAAGVSNPPSGEKSGFALMAATLTAIAGMALTHKRHEK